MISGPALFGRYAFPPNVHGYCGPADTGWAEGLAIANSSTELVHVAKQFEGAWPYLQVIAGCSARDPLDAKVVEAYWIGNELLDSVDLLIWGNSVDERFRHRSGSSWGEVESNLVEGQPNHAYHVFCVYPWVGLLHSGYADHALEVIDRCRIRWGTVLSVLDRELVVRYRPLTWDGRLLALGDPIEELVKSASGDDGPAEGDTVSLHWDYVCEVIDQRQLGNLQHQSSHHLNLANRSQRELSAVVEA